MVGQGFESPLRLQLGRTAAPGGGGVLVRIAAVLSQVIVSPTASPELNDGGWVYNAAILLALIGALIALVVVLGYMRYAPRFQTSEDGRKSVRAPRIQPGHDVRRPVNVTSLPIVVAPPSVAPAQPVAAAAASGGAAAASSVRPSVSAAAEPPAAPAAAPSSEATPSPRAEAPGEGPGGSAPPVVAPSTPAAGAAPPATAPGATPTAAPTSHAEVEPDQETFDRVLAEQLEQGKDRRVAEGQARRAAIIAARKKAEG